VRGEVTSAARPASYLHKLGDELSESRLGTLGTVLVAGEIDAFRRDSDLLSLKELGGELLRVVAGVADAGHDVGAVHDMGLHEPCVKKRAECKRLTGAIPTGAATAAPARDRADAVGPVIGQ